MCLEKHPLVLPLRFFALKLGSKAYRAADQLYKSKIVIILLGVYISRLRLIWRGVPYIYNEVLYFFYSEYSLSDTRYSSESFIHLCRSKFLGGIPDDSSVWPYVSCVRSVAGPWSWAEPCISISCASAIHQVCLEANKAEVSCMKSTT